MGFKRGEVAGFYPFSVTSVAITWMINGLSNREEIADKVGMKASMVRHWLRPHIKNKLILETKDEWRLSEEGLVQYKRYTNRKGMTKS